MEPTGSIVGGLWVLVVNTVPELSVAIGSIHDTSAAVVPGSALSTKFPGQPWTTGRDVSEAAVIVAGVKWSMQITKQYIMQNIYTSCIKKWNMWSIKPQSARFPFGSETPMSGGSHIDMVYVYVPAFWGAFSVKFGIAIGGFSSETKELKLHKLDVFGANYCKKHPIWSNWVLSFRKWCTDGWEIRQKIGIEIVRLFRFGRHIYVRFWWK